MPDFTVSFWDRDNSPVIAPAGLVFTPSRFGAVAQGGNDSADITVSGPELALHNLRNWLRFRVEITGAAGLLWEGHVDSILLNLAGVSISVGTEQMYNAIKVLYSYTGDDGGSESGETEWGTDADSINEFGRKEAIHSSGGETTSEAATALRDTVGRHKESERADHLRRERGRHRIQRKPDVQWTLSPVGMALPHRHRRLRSERANWRTHPAGLVIHGGDHRLRAAPI